MKYTVPKAEFLRVGNTDILTASVGIELPNVDFDKKPANRNEGTNPLDIPEDNKNLAQ